MKIHPSRLTPHAACARRGILLIECLVYMTVLFLVLALASALFYRCWDNSFGLKRNAEDIVRALQAGERWREDIRAATAPLHVEESADEQVLHIPQKSGETLFLFSQGAVWRRASDDAPWIEVLPKVKSSQMKADSRQLVTAWRWELELNSRRGPARVRPLFTFQAVPSEVARP